MRFNAEMYSGVGASSSFSMAATCTTGNDSGFDSDFIGSLPAETAHALSTQATQSWKKICAPTWKID
jgi:hypothetical protein